MNKIIKVAGLLAAGAAISSVGVSAEEGGNKVYTLNAGLRGFYDDNIFTGNNKSDLNGDGKPDRRKFASSGFEVTPGAVIGLLTILGYSLYDTVVVFDKIRENTSGQTRDASLTYGQQVNLGVNQTLVRSLNTAVVAALPVAAILFIGAFVLGAGTLRDISLALLVGIVVGTYSTIFLAAPLYAGMRMREPAIKKNDTRLLELQEKARERADA